MCCYSSSTFPSLPYTCFRFLFSFLSFFSFVSSLLLFFLFFSLLLLLLRLLRFFVLLILLSFIPFLLSPPLLLYSSSLTSTSNCYFSLSFSSSCLFQF